MSRQEREGWLILLGLAQVLGLPLYVAVWYWPEYRDVIQQGVLLALVGLALTGWVFEGREIGMSKIILNLAPGIRLKRESRVRQLWAWLKSRWVL